MQIDGLLNFRLAAYYQFILIRLMAGHLIEPTIPKCRQIQIRNMPAIRGIGKNIISPALPARSQFVDIFRVNFKFTLPASGLLLYFNGFINLRFRSYNVVSTLFKRLPDRKFHGSLGDLVSVNAEDR